MYIKFIIKVYIIAEAVLLCICVHTVCVLLQVFRRPWPGIMRTLYRNHERFENTYFKKFPGFYVTGDGRAHIHTNHILSVITQIVRHSGLSNSINTKNVHLDLSLKKTLSILREREKKARKLVCLLCNLSSLLSGCRRDKDGYYWITGRMDDMLNVSGTDSVLIIMSDNAAASKKKTV